jgi:hypothetical protein
MDLDVVRLLFPDGLVANLEEVVRDDVEAVEFGWVKIVYVKDLGGPALRPRSC